MIGPLECQSIVAIKELFDTNFFGLARLVKEVLPDMKRRQSGHIVVMSSVMGIQGVLVCVSEEINKRRDMFMFIYMFPYISKQAFCSTTSTLPPNSLWKDFVKVWQCRQ